MSPRGRSTVLGVAGLALAVAGQAWAETLPDPGLASPPAMEAAIEEAAALSGLPRDWLVAVMDVESARQPRVVSRAGAMGLMQLMPGTWRELRGRLGLGTDPFDVRDNLIAGATYLREMHDRFGSPGFLAAYNAGPERYAAHLAGRRTLPAETVAYVARLAPRIAGAVPAPAAGWRSSPLFPDAPAAALFGARAAR
ncbi:lytic transglycosylase domain-containing protein [Phenylobacterium sp.]|uniref:lytic transglycosylase domain-containing protein n=1 Tax=Phenylobacterium sp. TaxID=1871053 RepID=UPI002FDF0EB6